VFLGHHEAPAAFSRLQHQEPTSHEVGMQKPVECGAPCRLQHQEPTSHEVGMQEAGGAQLPL